MHYYVRYRCGYRGGTTALIVEDEQRTAYLFSDGWLQSKIEGDDAATRLAELMRRRGHWSRLPEVPPYTIDGLRRLTGAEAGGALPRRGLAGGFEVDAAL